MQRTTKILGLLAIAVLAGQRASTQPPEPTAAQQGAVTYYDQFEADVVLLGGETLHVDLRTWIVRGNLELERLPMEIDGPMIAQLRNGELETTIGDQRLARQEDSFWTVPRGVAMALETDEDAAVLDTIVIRE